MLEGVAEAREDEHTPLVGADDLKERVELAGAVDVREEPGQVRGPLAQRVAVLVARAHPRERAAERRGAGARLEQQRRGHELRLRIRGVLAQQPDRRVIDLALGVARVDGDGRHVPRREREPALRARVADHDVGEEPTQALGVARRRRILRVHELAAELRRRRELAGLQERDQVVDLFEIGLDGRRREQQEKPALDAVDELPPCGLPVLHVVRLVDDDEVPRPRLDRRGVPPAARERERRDDDAVVSPERLRRVAQAGVLRRARDDARLRLELAGPVAHERRGREDERAAHHAPELVLAQHHERLDRLAEAHLVREQRATAQHAEHPPHGLGLVDVRVDAAQAREAHEILEIRGRGERVRAQRERDVLRVRGWTAEDLEETPGVERRERDGRRDEGRGGRQHGLGRPRRDGLRRWTGRSRRSEPSSRDVHLLDRAYAASARASRGGVRRTPNLALGATPSVERLRRPAWPASGEPPACALLVEDASELGDVVGGKMGPEPPEERGIVDGRALVEHQHVGLVQGGAGQVGGPVQRRQRVELEEEQPLSRRGDDRSSLKGNRRPRRPGHIVEQRVAAKQEVDANAPVGGAREVRVLRLRVPGQLVEIVRATR